MGELWRFWGWMFGAVYWGDGEVQRQKGGHRGLECLKIAEGNTRSLRALEAQAYREEWGLQAGGGLGLAGAMVGQLHGPGGVGRYGR